MSRSSQSPCKCHRDYWGADDILSITAGPDRPHAGRRRKRDTRLLVKPNNKAASRTSPIYDAFSPGIPRLRAPITAVPGNYAISIIIRAAINELEPLNAALTFIAHESFRG